MGILFIAQVTFRLDILTWAHEFALRLRDRHLYCLIIYGGVFFWGAKCHEELDPFPHGSIGREAVAIQSAMLPCENSGEIIQSEYCTTRIMARKSFRNHYFTCGIYSSKIVLLRLLELTFFISINGCLNCLGPFMETLETLPKGQFFGL